MVIVIEQPPNNFRDTDIYPTKDEILGSRNFFRKNIIDGSYENVEEYLDIQFRLLREDFVANVREAIEQYQTKTVTKSLSVYSNIRIFKDKTKRNEDCLKIWLPENGKSEDDSKTFMNGSLLLFTNNNFRDFFMGKVVQKLSESQQVIIELLELNQGYVGQTYTMAECSQYFDPYFQVLSALKNISIENFPMEKYIVHTDTSSVYMPKYLLNSSQKYQIGGYQFSPEKLPLIENNFLGLNDAQFKAFKAALTQEFVVIQGPPGTGKTHLGVQIASTLITNSHFWYFNSPLLIITHKNDALDKFLEGLIPITDRLVRVGSQSKSEKLRPYNLTNDRQQKEGLNKKRPIKEDYFSKMRKALVIGMTTSLAARWKNHLENLKPPIVIVEEAAEVLEAHVLAALTNSCQHLVLLGDHQQLQPLSADHNINKKFLLGISLFERMVRNQVQHYRLEVQHRMRPEISKPLRNTIYPFLTDHESVLNRGDIQGLEKNVFFVNHQQPEETCNTTTKKNPFEARFLVSLARYLILNGHKSSDVVILATYNGQVQEIESLVTKDAIYQGVKISSLDGFQGQESEIILLSLVRSDEIGFLAKANRVCVALSRAKNGFYILGNMDLLTKNSRLWCCVKRTLESQKSLGSKLIFKCQNHGNLTKIESLDDFWRVQNGGCDKKCGLQLSCGHICCLMCHTDYMKHKCEKGCPQRESVIHKRNVQCNANSVQRSSYQQRFGNNNQQIQINDGGLLTWFKDTITNFIYYIFERLSELF